MKLPILELAQLKTKAERRPFCEEYGLSHKQLKRIIDDYNQGKYKVENEYIEVAPPSGEARELPNVPQTTIGQEPAVRKVPQAPSQGGWCYEIQNDKVPPENKWNRWEDTGKSRERIHVQPDRFRAESFCGSGLFIQGAVLSQ